MRGLKAECKVKLQIPRLLESRADRKSTGSVSKGKYLGLVTGWT